MSIKEFIEKWNVAFEDKEQKMEFDAEMMADIKSIKGFTTEDMVSFANMVSMYECDPETGLYYLHGQKYIKVVHKTTECLLRIWEEQK